MVESYSIYMSREVLLNHLNRAEDSPLYIILLKWLFVCVMCPSTKSGWSFQFPSSTAHFKIQVRIGSAQAIARLLERRLLLCLHSCRRPPLEYQSSPIVGYGGRSNGRRRKEKFLLREGIAY